MIFTSGVFLISSTYFPLHQVLLKKCLSHRFEKLTKIYEYEIFQFFIS